MGSKIIDRPSRLAQTLMEEKLKSFKGKKLDVNCGAGATFRGTVEDVENGILRIKDEMDVISHIAIEKIVVLTECSENPTRPGFIG